VPSTPSLLVMQNYAGLFSAELADEPSQRTGFLLAHGAEPVACWHRAQSQAVQVSGVAAARAVTQHHLSAACADLRIMALHARRVFAIRVVRVVRVICVCVSRRGSMTQSRPRGGGGEQQRDNSSAQRRLTSARDQQDSSPSEARQGPHHRQTCASSAVQRTAGFCELHP